MLKEFEQDTIVAISTPPGEGGIGVVRLSGGEAVAIADRIFRSTKKLPVKDQASFFTQHGHIVSETASGAREKIDEVLLLVMRAPKSYTCEDVVEISAHGNQVVLQAILAVAIRHGARLAARGEFTKRAFLNGRIDLLQAEAVLDLIKAKTPLGRRWAAAQLEGVLSEKMRMVKNGLVDLLSHLEATIDFPDDGVEPGSLEEAKEKLQALGENIAGLISKASLGSIAKNGLKVVIAGRPNVGKSSLMNRLSRMNRVIVTPYAGTTRDVVEEEIQIRGFPLSIMDTAGIQESEHPIEKEGIERSKTAVAAADLILYVVDGSQSWDSENMALLRDLEDRRVILVVNKNDLPQRLNLELFKNIADSMSIIPTSCVTESGLDLLENEIFSFIVQGKIQVSGEVVINSVRQKDLLEKTLKAIQDAKNSCAANSSPELVAVDIRLALDELGVLVGEVVTDDILDVLFNQFCIGK